eukprot:359028-Pyramimonas_sp.AAC.1
MHVRLVWSQFVYMAMVNHISRIGLKGVPFSADRGCLLEVRKDDDRRVLRVVRGVADAQGRFWTHRSGEECDANRVQKVLRA